MKTLATKIYKKLKSKWAGIGNVSITFINSTLKENRKDIETIMLDLKCSTTGEIIEIDEWVILHDWGVSRNELMIAKFEWNSHEKKFEMSTNELLNTILGYDNCYGIDFNYDLFSTSPRKLTQEEFDKIKDHI